MNTEERKAYKVSEVCKLIGMSRFGVNRALRTGELRSVRIGARILIPAEAISDMLKNTNKPEVTK